MTSLSPLRNILCATAALALVTGCEGPAGRDGLTGTMGAMGATGATGAQGPMGAMGAQGLKGDKGDTGPQGPSGTVGIKVGSYGQVPSVTLIPKDTFVMQDCKTPSYTAGAGETGILTANVTAYFTTADQRQIFATYRVDGGAARGVSTPANGMASVDAVANVTVSGVISLSEGHAYVFGPAIRPDFADAALDWVQCTTVVQIVKM